MIDFQSMRMYCAAESATRLACEAPAEVQVEYLPPLLRGREGAADWRGQYPHNGAWRLSACSACASVIVAREPDWARIVETMPARSDDAPTSEQLALAAAELRRRVVVWRRRAADLGECTSGRDALVHSDDLDQVADWLEARARATLIP